MRYNGIKQKETAFIIEGRQIIMEEGRGMVMEKAGKQDNFKKQFSRAVVIYLLLIAAVIIGFRHIWMLNFVPTGSMEPTIKKGDVVLGTRYDTGKGEIERYDILIFYPPDELDTTYIKRVIGLPGEAIEVRDGKVYANGEELDDSFVRIPMNRRGDGVYTVPEGCYFFLGDNRNNSNDSRFWKEKYVPLENIVAKSKYIIHLSDLIGDN